MAVKVKASAKKVITLLTKNNKFAPPIEGTKLWLTSATKRGIVQLLAYEGNNGVYFRIHADKEADKQYVSLGIHYDAMSSTEAGEVIEAEVALREINPEVDMDDVAKMVDNPRLANFTQQTYDRYVEAQENDYVTLIVTDYDDEQ